MGQAARNQPQAATDSQANSSTAGSARSQGSAQVTDDGETVDASTVNGVTGGSNGFEAQRTDSGRMLNPFASTFVPRTSSGTLLNNVTANL